MEPFWFGMFGGLAVNVLRLAELSNTPRVERPATFSDPLYVVQFLFLPLLGGGLAYTYHASGTILSPILAVNIGASAPLILKNFASIIPPLGPRKIN
jgi:membrane associated rhomboid family serine protease